MCSQTARHPPTAPRALRRGNHRHRGIVEVQSGSGSPVRAASRAQENSATRKHTKSIESKAWTTHRPYILRFEEHFSAHLANGCQLRYCLCQENPNIWIFLHDPKPKQFVNSSSPIRRRVVPLVTEENVVFVADMRNPDLNHYTSIASIIAPLDKPSPWIAAETIESAVRQGDVPLVARPGIDSPPFP